MRNVAQKWCIVLIYDSIRPHKTLDVIKLFKASKIAVVSIRDHTTNNCQTLEVWSFNIFKAFLQKAM